MTHMYFSSRAEGRISYGHLGCTNSCLRYLRLTAMPQFCCRVKSTTTALHACRLLKGRWQWQVVC